MHFISVLLKFSHPKLSSSQILHARCNQVWKCQTPCTKNTGIPDCINTPVQLFSNQLYFPIRESSCLLLLKCKFYRSFSKLHLKNETAVSCTYIFFENLRVKTFWIFRSIIFRQSVHALYFLMTMSSLPLIFMMALTNSLRCSALRWSSMSSSEAQRSTNANFFGSSTS